MGAIFTSVTNFLIQLSTYENKNINNHSEIKTDPIIEYQTKNDEVKINMMQNVHTHPPPIPTKDPYIEPKSYHSFNKNFKFYQKE